MIVRTMDSYDRKGGVLFGLLAGGLMLLEAFHPGPLGARIFATCCGLALFSYAWFYRKKPEIRLGETTVSLTSFPYRTRRWAKSDVKRFVAVKSALGVVPRIVLHVELRNGQTVRNDRFNCAPDDFPRDPLSQMCEEINHFLETSTDFPIRGDVH